MVAVTEATWRALTKTLREQERVITRAQALSLGLSPGQIRHRIRPDGGPWQCLVPGVYLAATGTPLSPGDWERTLARHTRMSRYGIVVLHFTPGQIRTTPEQVVTGIRSALLAGRPLGVRARPAA